MFLSENVSQALRIVFLLKKWRKACREKSAGAIGYNLQIQGSLWNTYACSLTNQELL